MDSRIMYYVGWNLAVGVLFMSMDHSLGITFICEYQFISCRRNVILDI